MKETTCCFSGHRDLADIDYNALRNNTVFEIKNLIEKGITTFICGGAIGFDLLAGLIVVQLKETNKNLKLILFLPHRKQDEFYSLKDKALYNHVKANADKIIYTSPDYYNGCFQLRNDCMIENSSYLLCFCTKKYGGSYYTKTRAKDSNLSIINVTADRP